MSRAERLGVEMRRVLGELVQREIKDPRVQSATLVTVTHVRVSDDLGVGDVLVSVHGDGGRDVVKALAKAAGFLRRELGRHLHTKKVPELRFHLDDTEEKAGRIDALLDEIRREPK